MGTSFYVANDLSRMDLSRTDLLRGDSDRKDTLLAFGISVAYIGLWKENSCDDPIGVRELLRHSRCVSLVSAQQTDLLNNRVDSLIGTVPGAKPAGFGSWDWKAMVKPTPRRRARAKLFQRVIRCKGGDSA
jgi:hypothetical protein